jgi:hypothetical protein
MTVLQTAALPLGYTALETRLSSCNSWDLFMAEREGFEPSRPVARPYRISNPAPSASWVPLLIICCTEFLGTTAAGRCYQLAPGHINMKNLKMQKICRAKEIL